MSKRVINIPTVQNPSFAARFWLAELPAGKNLETGQDSMTGFENLSFAAPVWLVDLPTGNETGSWARNYDRF